MTNEELRRRIAIACEKNFDELKAKFAKVDDTAQALGSRELHVSELKDMCTDALIEAYVNGSNGFQTVNGKPLLNMGSAERLLLADLYRMVRALYENRHEKTCQSDQGLEVKE